MMGWPDGWVTGVPGVSRNEALKLCGNGVVPQQAAAALAHILSTDVQVDGWQPPDLFDGDGEAA